MKISRVWFKVYRDRRFFFLYVLLIFVFVFNLCFQYSELLFKNVKNKMPQTLEVSLPYRGVFLKNFSQKSAGNHFRYNWQRMHRTRTDWQAIFNPCSDQMAWGTLKSGWGKINRSSARNSFITYMDIQQSGQFSRIFIQTRTASGQKKTIGGDFWRVIFNGPSSVSATVFDHQNGTYEAIALLVETGNYTVQAYLDYSLCDGLRDPPKNWFRIGNAQGKYQRAGILGFLDEYLYEPLLIGGKLFTVQVLPRKSTSSDLDFQCNKSCRSLWDGYGQWKDNRWQPFIPGGVLGETKVRRIRKGTLWIYGDSLGCRLYRSLVKKSLCNRVFSSCKCTYNWVYPVRHNNITLAKQLNDDLDFRPELVLASLRRALRHTVMKSPHSLMVLNFGLHYPISVNFTTFQKLIDDVVKMLGTRKRDLGTRAKVIWKTATAMHKENAEPPRNITHFRFSTEQRVRLFDAYAMSAMCEANIEVLDVYPLSASYPNGTVDITHYRDEVFFAVERELERYVVADLKKTKPVCME